MAHTRLCKYWHCSKHTSFLFNIPELISVGLCFILQNGNQSLCTEDLLSSCFSQLILTEGANLDYESLLQFYLDLSEEWREETKEGFDPALKPNIPLTTEAIQALVTNIGKCYRQRCCYPQLSIYHVYSSVIQFYCETISVNIHLQHPFVYIYYHLVH